MVATDKNDILFQKIFIFFWEKTVIFEGMLNSDFSYLSNLDMISLIYKTYKVVGRKFLTNENAEKWLKK